jgi:branched-subunit amino acid transport protein
MTAMILAVIALAAINILYKAAGPALLGDRHLPPAVGTALAALPVAVLAALLVVDLLGRHWQAFDWTLLPGLGIAVGLRAGRRSHLTCIVAGVAATAALRMLL